MPKSRKLTKFEEAYIEMNRGKFTVEDFNREIKGVGIKNIQKYLDEHTVSSNNNVEPKMPTADDLMVKKSGSVVMTEQASLLGDIRGNKPATRKSYITEAKAKK